MFDFIKRMTGAEGGADVAALVQSGAQIVDVRSPDEFHGGHVKGSVNIPLPGLERGLSKLRKDRPVITCCASGMRSASAKSLLDRHGFDVVNGGSWASVARQLQA